MEEITPEEVREILEKKINGEKWNIEYHSKEVAKAKATLAVFEEALRSLQ